VAKPPRRTHVVQAVGKLMSTTRYHTDGGEHACGLSACCSFSRAFAPVRHYLAPGESCRKAGGTFYPGGFALQMPCVIITLKAAGDFIARSQTGASVSVSDACVRGMIVATSTRVDDA